MSDTPQATTGQITATDGAELAAITAQAAEAINAPETAEIAAEATAEAAPEPQKAPEDRFSAKFAALSRKEKSIRDRENALKQQAADLEAKYGTERAEIEKYKALPDRLKREPLKVLEESGLTFQQLAEMVLNDGKPTHEMVLNEKEKQIMDKIAQMEAKIAEKEQKEQEQKYEQTLQTFVSELTEFVNTEKDYELIRANDAVELVYKVIEDYHTETGKVLANKEACDAVEEHLLAEAKKHLELDKIKSLLQPAPQPKATETKRQSQTLSNAQAAQAPTKGQRTMSEDESKREAAKLIKWVD